MKLTQADLDKLHTLITDVKAAHASRNEGREAAKADPTDAAARAAAREQVAAANRKLLVANQALNDFARDVKIDGA